MTKAAYDKIAEGLNEARVIAPYLAEIKALKAELAALRKPVQDEELREIIVGELGGCNCNVDDVVTAISPMIRAREANAAEAMREAAAKLASDVGMTYEVTTARDRGMRVVTYHGGDDAIRALPNPYGRPA